MTRIVKAISASVVVLVTMLALAGPASAHGYTDEPKSRGRWCQVGEVKGCGAVQYEPQSTEGPKGFPDDGPADGHLCSAGIDRFHEIDAAYTPQGAPWPVTTLAMGSEVTFRWYLTAPHKTTTFRYFVTKEGWDREHPLTRYSLDLQPFYVDEWNGAIPGRDVEHTVHVPHRNGHHLILAVWDIDDTANAFYSCADVYIS